MKKSDLPWILPLLTAWSQGKTLQVRCSVSGKWYDHEGITQIKFTGAEGDYRIKPELKSPGQVYYETRYTLASNHWKYEMENVKTAINDAAIAVLRAYKNGELDLTGLS